MITERDLQEAIAECRSVKNPTANTCMKLAAYYSILDHIESERKGYSYSSSEESEFLKAVVKIPENEAWAIMDELMKTLQVLHPRLYDGVMRKVVRQ